MRRNSTVEYSNQQPASPRQAFTLIELMIVIVVIASLMGLLLPAVTGGFRRARIAQVATEIRGLEAGIAQFKASFGIEPPSRIRLYETPSGWSSTHSGTFYTDVLSGQVISNDSERTRSIAIINRIWPSFVFSNASGWDFNHDNSIGGFVTLTGSECLVFFLGGWQVGPVGGPFALTGFSKNPANPFVNPGATESREGPFFEFKPNQLRRTLNVANDIHLKDASGMTLAGTPIANGQVLMYVDPLPSQLPPYIYASGYDGRGYQRADLIVSPNELLTDVYRQGAGFATVAQKQKAFQIISPGADGKYGFGGQFNTTLTNKGLTYTDDTNGNGALDSGEDINRNSQIDIRPDSDNITNFSGGVLNE